MLAPSRTNNKPESVKSFLYKWALDSDRASKQVISRLVPPYLHLLCQLHCNVRKGDERRFDSGLGLPVGGPLAASRLGWKSPPQTSAAAAAHHATRRPEKSTTRPGARARARPRFLPGGGFVQEKRGYIYVLFRKDDVEKRKRVNIRVFLKRQSAVPTVVGRIFSATIAMEAAECIILLALCIVTENISIGTVPPTYSH